MTDWNLDNLTKEEFDAMCAITEGQDHRPEPSYAEILAKVQEMREAKEESDYRRDREIERAEFRGNYGRAHELREQKKWTESFNKKQEDAYYAQREVNRAKTRREKAFQERSQDDNTCIRSRINGLKALLLGTAATVIAGAAGITYTLSNSKKENKDPEDGKNKKEVVLPPDNKNVIEVEGDIDDAKAAELVKEYKKQHSAEAGKDNNKGQTYYIAVKNSKKQGR